MTATWEVPIVLIGLALLILIGALFLTPAIILNQILHMTLRNKSAFHHRHSRV